MPNWCSFLTRILGRAKRVASPTNYSLMAARSEIIWEITWQLYVKEKTDSFIISQLGLFANFKCFIRIPKLFFIFLLPFRCPLFIYLMNITVKNLLLRKSFFCSLDRRSSSITSSIFTVHVLYCSKNRLVNFWFS